MSRWFGDLSNGILRWDQIYLKSYQISFPSSAHWPRLHSGWMSYDLPNEALSGCRWTESSTLMDLHFETHLYLYSNNDMYMWNQVNCTQNYYVNVGTSAPYNQWSYPLVDVLIRGGCNIRSTFETSKYNGCNIRLKAIETLETCFWNTWKKHLQHT
jgi:hypothetical protein